VNRRKFISGTVTGGVLALAGCTTISGDDYSSPASISIDLRNNKNSSNSVQLLVESTTDHIHWSNYDVSAGDNEIINIEVPDDKQFTELHIQSNDEVYTADFDQWNDIDGSCGSVIFEMRDDDRGTDLYYSTRGVGDCA